MLKKTLMVVAVVLMAVPAFAAYNPFMPAMDPNNIRPDQTVDWESDGNHRQRKAEVWNWPATYDFVPICDMKVQMDIGFWIRVTDCANQIIKVKQVFINQYYGEAKCKAYTNVATKWEGKFTKANDVDLGNQTVDGVKDMANYEATITPATFDAKPGGQEIIAGLRLKDVEMANLVPNQNSRCTDIGIFTIRVKPNVAPNYFMSSCDYPTQKYPVYAPTK